MWACPGRAEDSDAARSPGELKGGASAHESSVSRSNRIFDLARNAKRNGNFVLVRNQKREPTCQNRRVEHTAAGKRKHFADPFWLLASDFSYPAAFRRDIKGAALAWLETAWLF